MASGVDSDDDVFDASADESGESLLPESGEPSPSDEADPLSADAELDGRQGEGTDHGTEMLTDGDLANAVVEHEDSDEADPLVGEVVADRYRVLELLGRGGMGSVYRGEHTLMKRQVAIKVLHREMTVLPEVVKRFEREAIAAGRIDHINVAQATDFGQLPDGAFYLVLEYVEGRSLQDALKHEVFSSERAARIGRQIALALDAARTASIVHRDLKPDNVMLIDRVEEPELVKVLDFGIAKVSTREVGRSDAPITRMGAIFGTPEYMAPEQAAGQSVDYRADLYCLGLLMYRMLAGRPPFRGEEVSSVLAMQITQPPPPLPEAVDSDLSAIVMALLEKQPDDRLGPASEVARRLGLYLGSPSITSEIYDDGLASTLSPDLPPTRRTGRQKSVLDRFPQLERPVSLGSWSVPLWRVAALGGALGAALLAGVVVVAALSSSSEPSQAAAVAEPASEPTASAVAPAPGSAEALVDHELETLLAKAFAGNRAAIVQLEKRPVESRSARVWFALARGKSKLGKDEAALEAYDEALTKDPAIAEDSNVVRAVHAATRNPETASIALHIAADHLGRYGADLLYDVWVRDRERTPTTSLAEKLLKSDEVRSKASPALETALRLRDAEKCDELRELLPHATLHGDRRSLRLLAPLRRREDCEIPLATLEAAISAVRERPPPAL